MIQQPTINPSLPPMHDLHEDDAERLERDPMIGRCLADRYIVREVIGEGAMGRVFLAEQLSVGRSVAIKVMKSELFKDPGLAGRFKLEMEIISSLQHSSIVRLLDTGHDEALDAHFIVMEYVEGIPLGDLLYDREVSGALVPELAIEIAIQLCSALTEPHQLGVIHRDIKPDNIILTVQSDEQLAIKLLDFGVARVVDPHEKIDSAAARARLTATGGIVGTPPYIAPELCEGSSHASHQSDLYAIGAMLFELLTGHPPFQGRSTAELLFMHVHEPAPRLREHVVFEHCAGDALEELILHLLEKSPDDRPRSALDVKKRLEEILAHNDLVPPSITLPASGSTYQALAPFIVEVRKPRSTPERISLQETLESDPATKTLAGNPVFVMTPRQTTPDASDDLRQGEELEEALLTEHKQDDLCLATPSLIPPPEAVTPLRTRGNASHQTGIFTPEEHGVNTKKDRRITTSIAASFGLGVLLLAAFFSYTPGDTSAHTLGMLPLATKSMAQSSQPEQSEALIAQMRPTMVAKSTPSVTHASSALHDALSQTSSKLTRPSSHAAQAASALHGKARALSNDLAERTSRVEKKSTKKKTLKVQPSTAQPDHNTASSSAVMTVDHQETSQPKKRLKRIKKKIDWLYRP